MAREKIAGPAAGDDESPETIVIKKYENRRLYDTSASSYVNLERVAQLVRDGCDVKVVEAKGGRDVTRQVLTQIIVENARDREGGPPLEFLKELVRASDRAHRDFFEWYLGSAAEVYRGVRGAWERAYRRGPAGAMPDWPRPDWTRFWGPAALTGPLSQLLSGGLQRSRSRAGSDERNPSSADDSGSEPRDEAADHVEAEAQQSVSAAVGESAPDATANDGDELEELSELRRRLEQLEQRLQKE